MSNMKLIATITIGVGSCLVAGGKYILENRKSIYKFLIHSFNKIFSSSIFKENEINIITKYLEEKYLNEIKPDLNILFPLIIENKKLLTKLADDVKKLSLKKNFKEEKKRIFLLGETGVGKSTLINCIEDKILAIEAKTDAPTTMEYKEYESQKYKSYIFCDTRGMEKIKNSEIEKNNIKTIIEKIKGLGSNSYLFWYLKGSSQNFQDLDTKFIKSIEKSLNRKIPLFFIITRSVDEDKEKIRLSKAVKEYFPYTNEIQIFPVMARGSKRVQSFGLDELMSESQNYFQNYIIDEVLNDKYKENDKDYDEILKSSINNNSSIEKILSIILNHIKLEKCTNKLNDGENKLIEGFCKGKYQSFIDNKIIEIINLCCLIKAKNEVIDVDNYEETFQKLTAINNSIEPNNENSLEAQILEGYSDSNKEKILSKYRYYKSESNIKEEVKKIINWFFSEIFILEFKNQVKNSLKATNGLFD